ncbi:MAG: alpha/beta fold hydrolase [Thermoleophilia bacterium]|nr:alpha/beta fold hydrolase [Thermoleophilia bacterium]
MLRRLLPVALVALAVASPADAFSKQDGTQAMDDGVTLATSLYLPDGQMPAGGWPGVVVLHGLAGNRGTVELLSTSFAEAGFAVLAYDARGHGASGGVITLAGPREVADLRAIRNAFAGRADVSDTKIGAWGISYGGGQIWNALAAGVPFAAAEVVETWTSLYDALWPQGLARSGIVAGFAASVASRSPLITSLRDAAVQSTNPAAIKELTGQRSALAKASSITTPTYLFQGRVDFAFDITQAKAAYDRLRGPRKLYVGAFGHTPSTFPGPDVAYVVRESQSWFRTYLSGGGAPAGGVVIAPEGGTKPPVALPGTKTQTFAFRGRSVARGIGVISRRTAPLKAALESWGGGTVTVSVPKLTRYPRLVVTVLAGNKVVAHGGLRPKSGTNVVRLANYCVYVPKGTRLRVAVGAASPPGQIAYLGFAGSGSATIGNVTLKLSTLAKPISG